jgi:hypothetical protein
VLDQAVEVWAVFTQTFLEPWEDEEHHRGEMFKRCASHEKGMGR